MRKYQTKQRVPGELILSQKDKGNGVEIPNGGSHVPL